MNQSLCFDNIEKVFGERVLLSVDAFEIAPGEFTLITGDNGSGKTTLLKIISGLQSPEQATVTINDTSMPWARAKRELRKLIVYLHQSPYMFDTTVFNNVAYGLRVAHLPKAEIEERVWQSLHWGKLDHLTHRSAKLLSGGESQRVALTRARIMLPEILVLDEPTANMDQRSRNQTYSLIEELRSEGMSILIVTHEAERFTSVVDHHYHLEGGHLLEISQARSQQSNGVVTPFRRKDQH